MSSSAASFAGVPARPESPSFHTSEDTISTPSGSASHQNSDSEGSSEALQKVKSRSKYFTSPKISFSLFSSGKVKEESVQMNSSGEASENITSHPVTDTSSIPHLSQWTASPSVVTWYYCKPSIRNFAPCSQHSGNEKCSALNTAGSMITNPPSKDSSVLGGLAHGDESGKLSSEADYSVSVGDDGQTESTSADTDQTKGDSSTLPAGQKSSFFSSMMKKISSAVRSSKSSGAVQALRAQAAEALQVLDITKRKFEEAEQRASESESHLTEELVRAVDALAKAEEAARKKWSWIGSPGGAAQDVPALRAQVVEAKRALEEMRDACSAELDALR
eukprot:CAMPEP_0172178952 /NCGR_PEP_ID=MMETSP1050-20130122/16333_1 /TAXON_ID=233186 /ORGANISM="Cryptomonas curvata, Strain CCAP979/52" /LENGTH=332 /DNA_ID=CAMNT_0012851751 /DNA_START=257 /DNA_END=1252 /DNA_ORIENTATION=-